MATHEQRTRCITFWLSARESEAGNQQENVLESLDATTQGGGEPTALILGGLAEVGNEL